MSPWSQRQRVRRRRSPPRRGTACRTRSSSAAARSACGRRRRASSSSRAGRGAAARRRPAGAHGPDGVAVVVEHADQRVGEVADVGRVGVDGGSAHAAGGRNIEVGEVGSSPGRAVGSGTWNRSAPSSDIVGGLWRQRIRRSTSKTRVVGAVSVPASPAADRDDRRLHRARRGRGPLHAARRHSAGRDDRRVAASRAARPRRRRLPDRREVDVGPRRPAAAAATSSPTAPRASRRRSRTALLMRLDPYRIIEGAAIAAFAVGAADVVRGDEAIVHGARPRACAGPRSSSGAAGCSAS